MTSLDIASLPDSAEERATLAVWLDAQLTATHSEEEWVQLTGGDIARQNGRTKEVDALLDIVQSLLTSIETRPDAIREHLPGKHDQSSHAHGSAGRKAAAHLIPISPSDDRAFNGKPVPLKKKLSKTESGRLGEAAVLAHLHRNGHTDAHALNVKAANYPVDLVHDHQAVEVKAGLVSNTAGAQQWRATIGEPSKREKAWLRRASPTDKAAWNKEKQEKILARKERARAAVERRVGEPVRGKTITTIIDPDRRRIDVFEFDGFHLRLSWRGPETEKAYVGSYTY